MEAFFPVENSHYTLMPQASDVPCIRGFISGLSSEERAHWKLHIGISMVAGTLRRATILDSVCPEKEILTAIVAGLLHSYPRGVVQKPEACRLTPSRIRESMVIVQLKVKCPHPLWIR